MSTVNKHENGEIIEDEQGYLIYCENGEPIHAGAVCVDGKIYYAGHDGELVCGHHKDVHRDMANGLLKRGIYKFDENGVLVEGSYQKPERKRTKKRAKLTKKQRQLVVGGILLGILILAAMLLAVFGRSAGAAEESAASASAGGTPQTATINLPQDNSPVYLCSSAMQSVYEGNLSLKDAIRSGASPYLSYSFRYSMRPDASAVLSLDGKTYELDPGKTELEIPNLKTGSNYVYTVTVTEGDVTNTVDGFFRTADTNRFLRFTGVQNTRDIGGYLTADGKRVREGMIIRGTEIDGLEETGYYLKNPEETGSFGFRYDFDLRASQIYTGNYISRLGKDVGHRFYNCPAYAQIFRAEFFPILRQIFEDLADANNYPMYLHCTYGSDRTGTIVYLLQGLLGVPEEQMNFEYALSGFMTSGYEDLTHIRVVQNGLAGYPGSSINEQIEHFLTETVGVTEAQVQSIRSILLENDRGVAAP